MSTLWDGLMGAMIDGCRDSCETKLDGLSDDQRRTVAVAELNEADHRLTVADAALENGVQQLGMDVVAGRGWGHEDQCSRLRSEAVVQAAGEMAKASQHFENDAEVAGQFPVSMEEIFVNRPLLVLDENLCRSRRTSWLTIKSNDSPPGKEDAPSRGPRATSTRSRGSP